MFNSWGIVNAYGTYASYYMQHLLPGQDILLFNLVGSTQSFTVLALSAVVGRFLDAGYHRTLIITGSVLVTLGSFLISVSAGGGGYGEGNYGLIWFTQGLLSGLGMACFFVTSSQGMSSRSCSKKSIVLTDRILVVATWFRKKKGFAIGIVASGASIAGLLYPMMLKFLIPKVGFNNAQRYTSTLTAATCIIAILVARPNPEHLFRKPQSWAKVDVWVDTHAFRNRSFCWLCAAISFLFFGFYAVFFNLEEWAAETGIGYKDDPRGGPLETDATHDNAMRAFWLLSIMNATSTLGRLSSAYLCDHFGALNVHCFVTLVASLLTLILWTLADTVTAALAFVVVFGVFSGAVIGLPPASVAHILGPNPAAQAKLGQWTGMMYTCAAAPALTGPVIAGHLITEFLNDFRTVQLWAGACMFLSACCMGAAIYSKHAARADEWFEEKRRRLSSVTSLGKRRGSGAVSQREVV